MSKQPFRERFREALKSLNDLRGFPPPPLPERVRVIVDKNPGEMTKEDIQTLFHYTWGRNQDRVYDKRLWVALDRLINHLSRSL